MAQHQWREFRPRHNAVAPCEVAHLLAACRELVPIPRARVRLRGQWERGRVRPYIHADRERRSLDGREYFPAPGSTTSSWTHAPSNQAYKGTLTTSTKANEYARYTFTGRDVAYVASLDSNQGQATVKIDGIAYSTVNLYRSTSAGAQIVVSRHWASLGTHTIEVRTAKPLQYRLPYRDRRRRLRGEQVGGNYPEPGLPAPPGEHK